MGKINKFMNGLVALLMKIGEKTHKFLVPILGSFLWLIFVVGARQQASIGFVVNGEVIETNFDSITKGWYSYVVIAIGAAWLMYLANRGLNFINGLRQKKKEVKTNENNATSN